MRALLALPVLLALSACGAQVRAPSLAPRPGEARGVDLPDPEREAETPLDQAIAARLADLGAAAEAGDQAFAAARGMAERAVAAAADAPPGTERWTTAQQALSTLEVARGSVREAAAGIAALRQEPGAAGTGTRSAIDAAAARVEAIEAMQAQVASALAGRLR